MQKEDNLARECSETEGKLIATELWLKRIEAS
jgi:hypothetical protein